jgi:oxygen-dependent protoporphyrinogen oxidase
VVRVSLGGDGNPVDDLDDDAATDAAVHEVGRHLGLDLQPAARRVSRWPEAFPQYRPGHAGWWAGVQAALPPRLYVAGASYGGIGVPACIAQARATAHRLLAELHPSGAD